MYVILHLPYLTSIGVVGGGFGAPPVGLIRSRISLLSGSFSPALPLEQEVDKGLGAPQGLTALRAFLFLLSRLLQLVLWRKRQKGKEVHLNTKHPTTTHSSKGEAPGSG